MVEDDPALAASLVRSLDLEGHEASEVCDAETSLVKLNAHPVDCIVMDVGLPGSRVSS